MKGDDHDETWLISGAFRGRILVRAQGALIGRGAGLDEGSGGIAEKLEGAFG